MKKLFTTLTIVFLGVFVYAQIGSIENIEVEQREDGTGMVDIHFDLSGVENTAYHIAIEASFDGGDNYEEISPDFLSGDLEDIMPATGLHIVWDGLASNPNTFTEEAIVKIIAELDDGSGEVTDIDGNVYPTVTINDRQWTAAALRVTQYNNGDPIETGLDDDEWSNTFEGAYAIYPHEEADGIDSDDEMKETYGLHYNWFAVDDDRGLCPEGWSVPTDDEFQDLREYLLEYDHINNSSVGSVLKSCRQVNAPAGGECDTEEHPRWNEQPSWASAEGTDEFGFSAFGIGQRRPEGNFEFILESKIMWTSSEENFENGRSRSLPLDWGGMGGAHNAKQFGFGVRCVKDIEE